MSVFRKHLFAVLGVVFLLPYVIRGIIWILDWQGRIETVISDFRDGKFGIVIEFLLSPPPWTIWPALACGFAFFGIDYYRNTRHHREAKRHPIIPILQWESPPLRGPSDSQAVPLWNNIFYLVLQNQDPNRTIRNVSVQINTLESIERCPVKATGLFAFDIRHGDYVYYRLGRVVSSEFCGLPGGGVSTNSCCGIGQSPGPQIRTSRPGRFGRECATTHAAAIPRVFLRLDGGDVEKTGKHSVVVGLDEFLAWPRTEVRKRETTGHQENSIS